MGKQILLSFYISSVVVIGSNKSVRYANKLKTRLPKAKKQKNIAFFIEYFLIIWQKLNEK